METRTLADKLTEIALAFVYVVGTSLAVAAFVFCCAYGQQIAFWNWTISLGPDLYVAGGMAVFAFFVTAWASLFGPESF